MIVQLASDIRGVTPISSTVLSAFAHLSASGIETTICASVYSDEEHKDIVSPISVLNALGEDDMAILHFGSLGFDLIREFAQADCKKVLFFYGILEPDSFGGFCSGIQGALDKSLRQLKYAIPKVDLSFSVSDWTDAQLAAVGYSGIAHRAYPLIVAPVSDFSVPSDERLAFSNSRGIRILSYGPVAANRCYDKVIGDFAFYKKHLDPDAVLCILGAYKRHSPYCSYLAELIDSYGIDGVLFDNEQEDLMQYLASADIFLAEASSEDLYQGYVAAMNQRVPILARDSQSVRGIVEEGGILVEDCNSALMGSLIGKLADEPGLREIVVERGLEKAADYTEESMVQRFVDKVIRYSQGALK